MTTYRLLMSDARFWRATVSSVVAVLLWALAGPAVFIATAFTVGFFGLLLLRRVRRPLSVELATACWGDAEDPPKTRC